jgi:uncharacterized protein HemX
MLSVVGRAVFARPATTQSRSQVRSDAVASMTIGKKLLGAFALMLVLVLGILGLYVVQTRSGDQQLNVVLHRTNKSLKTHK